MCRYEWWINHRQQAAEALDAKARFEALDAKCKQTKLNLFRLTIAAKAVTVHSLR